MRALVTGATGFVGSHVARTLVSDGDEVHALVRAGAGVDRVPDLVDRVAFHTDPGTALDELVRELQPDVTFHFATHFVAEHGVDDVTPMIVANVTFPTRLADALARTCPGAVFVNTGTAWQHVDGDAYRPKNLYAATKQAFEDVLVYYASRELLRVVTVNLYDTYGPLDLRGKLVSALVNAVRSGTSITMGSGVQLLDLVHIRDAAGAFLLAGGLAGTNAAPAYAVSSGAPITARRLVEVLGEVAGTPVPVEWGARPDRAGDMTKYWDAGPALPGWQPTIDLRTGLAELLAEERP
jgi:nucleoside-diphosphate-sugar epimerase